MRIYIMHTIYEVIKDDYIQTMVLDFLLISFGGGIYIYIIHIIIECAQNN